MASHHDEDTMPEETQGYKLSQPKQSLAEYQQMGMSINTYQTSYPQRGNDQWAAHEPLCKQVYLQWRHSRLHLSKQVLCVLPLGLSRNPPGCYEPRQVNHQPKAPPTQDETIFTVEPRPAPLVTDSSSELHCGRLGHAPCHHRHRLEGPGESLPCLAQRPHPPPPYLFARV